MGACRDDGILRPLLQYHQAAQGGGGAAVTAQALLAVPGAGMGPYRAVRPPFQHRHIAADHGDLVRVEPLPVQILGAFSHAAGAGQQPGPPAPQEGHRVEEAAAAADQRVGGQLRLGAELHVLIAVAGVRQAAPLQILLQQVPGQLQALRRDEHVIILTVHPVGPRAEPGPCAGGQKAVADGAARIFGLIDAFVHISHREEE